LIFQTRAEYALGRVESWSANFFPTGNLATPTSFPSSTVQFHLLQSESSTPVLLLYGQLRDVRFVVFIPVAITVNQRGDETPDI
jgi:hypothetical protein